MSQRMRGDRGQTIFLAPVGFIIVLLLGGVVLEAGNLHLRQRQLDDLADSIASDAAGVGFDIDHFRASGDVRVNQAAATSVVVPSIAISNLPEARLISVAPSGTGLAVDLEYDHEFIFGRRIFGLSQTLDATGNAELLQSG